MTIGLNESYPKGTKGILKMLEIVVTCIAFALIIDHFSGWYKHGKVDFFVSLHIAAFIIAIIFFIVFLINLDNTLGNSRCWNILDLVACIILGILCIVSSALLADHYSSNCRGCGKYIGGFVCGFISAILFLIDAVVHFKEIR
ncbi:uncharacterized protein LOC5518012 [Nematostella vectensis]|uniref:uncharacterized protein LOC5518012 n=1 Tax=Nematostella vectensis TaxID=45351 RepID=UPI00207711E9|nr:uncharacterized protein LOC5518012 [Nematostella vectensis]